MNDFFIWNGVRSTLLGVYVSEQPPITLPQERSTQTVVPGRPGSLTTLEGEDVYDEMTLTADCFIADPALIPAIAGWLRGGGEVTFANRMGGHYRARIANQIPFEKILRGNPHCQFAVNFRCFPFWYAENVKDIALKTTGETVFNPGTVYSEPVIAVAGSGDVTLTVGDTQTELSGLTTGIRLDSELKEAYQGTTLMNGHMSGDFPVLRPGLNTVSWSGSGTVTGVTITPRWRYL